jgi:Domain of unknown function (DUF6973)
LPRSAGSSGPDTTVDLIRRMTTAGMFRLKSLKWLLPTAMLLLAGCSTTRPTPTFDEGTRFCSEVPTGTPPQNAPDDCLKEVCREGRLEHLEDLTETAAVHDWAEEGFCFFHPIDCVQALSVKDHVLQWEQDKASAGLWSRTSLQGGPGDAARHVYLACLLTERFGEAFARGLLEAHEEDSNVIFGFGIPVKGNRCCDKVMDRNNNRIGVELAARPGSCEEKALQALPRLRHSLCTK